MRPMREVIQALGVTPVGRNFSWAESSPPSSGTEQCPLLYADIIAALHADLNPFANVGCGGIYPCLPQPQPSHRDMLALCSGTHEPGMSQYGKLSWRCTWLGKGTRSGPIRGTHGCAVGWAVPSQSIGAFCSLRAVILIRGNVHYW